MANTTFTGPVVSLNGFIGGANENAQDTAQGGKISWTVSNASTVQIATGTRAGEELSAVGNDGVMIYVSNGFSNAATYAFSDGTTWKRVQDGADIATGA